MGDFDPVDSECNKTEGLKKDIVRGKSGCMFRHILFPQKPNGANAIMPMIWCGMRRSRVSVSVRYAPSTPASGTSLRSIGNVDVEAGQKGSRRQLVKHSDTSKNVKAAYLQLEHVVVQMLSPKTARASLSEYSSLLRVYKQNGRREGYIWTYTCSICGYRSDRTIDVKKHIQHMHSVMGAVKKLNIEEASSTIDEYLRRKRTELECLRHHLTSTKNDEVVESERTQRLPMVVPLLTDGIGITVAVTLSDIPLPPLNQMGTSNHRRKGQAPRRLVVVAALAPGGDHVSFLRQSGEEVADSEKHG
uniref:C2H2-type domain-containing protein n=1 Tax=Echinococcus canadensis TaxID=519352 RepID=A0A915EW97_9CEST